MYQQKSNTTRISAGEILKLVSKDQYDSDEIIDYEEEDDDDDDAAVQALTNVEIEEIYLDDNFMTVEEDGDANDDDNVDSDEKTDLYHCSTCNVNFHSVEEHIQEFHGDQEVVVEVDDVNDDNILEIPVEESLAVDEPLPVDESLPEIKLEEPDDDDDEVEHYIGADGAMYVKEVVKIDAKSGYKLTTSKYLITSKLIVPTNAIYCEICSAPFATDKSLKLHMRLHNGNASVKKNTKVATVLDQSCVCSICNTVFKSFKSLK